MKSSNSGATLPELRVPNKGAYSGQMKSRKMQENNYKSKIADDIRNKAS